MELEKVLVKLNAFLASEEISAQQYFSHEVSVNGIYSTQLAGVFAEHAADELRHAAMLRNQIHILGGTLDNELTAMVQNNPVTGPKDVQHADFAQDMLTIDLDGENQAINNYKTFANEIRDEYPGLFSDICEILNDELHHAQELTNLLGV